MLGFFLGDDEVCIKVKTCRITLITDMGETSWSYPECTTLFNFDTQTVLYHPITVEGTSDVWVAEIGRRAAHITQLMFKATDDDHAHVITADMDDGDGNGGKSLDDHLVKMAKAELEAQRRRRQAMLETRLAKQMRALVDVEVDEDADEDEDEDEEEMGDGEVDHAVDKEMGDGEDHPEDQEDADEDMVMDLVDI
ncbi:hypothetical protein BD324DRAFT_680194 [Kockovaella imperatae]|uniref:Uncharacterized protein n=1 Tax=Kockovaella imperatae TaxID=4999 RepID=A0A1Y1UK82_9TREE|nr:hypothetical protein BD324DRAFT_680194 [Kockovaella imperatae]ORX38463.1 hypothetical protein BD324DRAFT_680194 [Kockovaella imperatae]